MAEKVVKTLDLASGFTVEVSPLPPYYMDLVDERFPFPEYPSRKINLISGDVAEWPYDPPEDEKDIPAMGDDDYELYAKWRDVHAKRRKVSEKRQRARIDYLLGMCVEIVDGPIDFEDESQWDYKFSAAFPDFELPESKGEKYLLFLKHFVIRSAQDLNLVIASSTAKEVSMQGIQNALQGFRDILEEGRPGEDHSEEE